MHHQSSENDWFGIVGGIVLTMLVWLYFVAIGAWWLSMVTTKYLLKGLDLLLDGLLDKEDGLIVLIPALLWPAVWLVLFYWLVGPELRTAPPDQARIVWWVFLGCGLAWGCSIGAWLLMTEYQQLPTAPADFTQALELPAEHYDSVAKPEAEEEKVLTVEELEALYADELEREDIAEKEPLKPAKAENDE